MNRKVLPTILAIGLVCSQALAAMPKVGWNLRYDPDGNPNPKTVITLMVGAKKVLIATDAGEFSEVKRSEFKDRHVPSSALIACTGWFAGGGDTYYVKKVGKYLKVYDISQDEQAPDGLRMIRRIRL